MTFSINNLDLQQKAIFSMAYQVFHHELKSGYVHTLQQYRTIDAIQNQAYDFLQHSKNKREDNSNFIPIMHYLSELGKTLISLRQQEKGHEEKILLPTPAPLMLSFQKTMSTRKSQRYFTGDPVSINEISSLLFAANGISHEIEVENIPEIKSISQRTVASAGGLYPVQIYVYFLKAKPFPKACYVYNPFSHSLIPHFADVNNEDFLKVMGNGDSVISYSQASLFLVLTGTPWRVMRKYSNRGLRFLLHEIGAISQNIHLAANAIGLAGVDNGSFYDDELSELLQLSKDQEIPFHTIILGTKSE